MVSRLILPVDLATQLNATCLNTFKLQMEEWAGRLSAKESGRDVLVYIFSSKKNGDGFILSFNERVPDHQKLVLTE